MPTRLSRAVNELVSILGENSVKVLDAEYNDVKTITLSKGTRYVLVIGKVKSLRRKFFVLCHEVGHFMYLSKKGLRFRKYPTSSEESANRVACKMISMLDKKLVKKFEIYYNQLNKNSCRVRFKA